jgi:hypothetical protein
MRELFHANLPDDVLVLHNAPRVPIPSSRPDLPELTEPNLDSAFLLWVKLRDESGDIVGTATEIEVWPDEKIEPGYLWDTCWVLTLPQRGALYVHQHETIGIMQDIIEPMRRSGQDWEGNFRRTSTAGPREDGAGVIVGGAGEFAGATGTLHETNNITHFTLEGVQTNRCELLAEYELAPSSSAKWPWQ